MDYGHGGDSSDSAYSSTTTSSTNLRLNIENELTHAFFHAKDIIGSGRTGDVLKLKIDSNNKFLAFKFVDIYTRKRDIKKELKNEIQIYKWLQNKNIECIPKLVFDGVVLIFLSLVTEIVDGKIIEFNKMNQDQKNSCIESLKTLHINGVLHKDLRPSNFIIKENNQCIIIDFGFSEKYEQINEKEQELFEIEMDELKELLYASN
jgi:serine/threonine protein kinase